jgi:hypothetical protein
MGIKITQPGEAAAAAKAGSMIGAGKRAEKEQARAEREQARADQIAAQQQARKAALQWEQEKMLLNSQQDFAHEMRMRQAQLDKEARAQEWEVEKMEMASRLDFEQEERERQRDNAMWAAGDKAIDESDMPDVEKARARFRNWQKHPDAPGAQEDSGFKEETKDIDPNIRRRKELEAVVGPEFGRALSLQELEEEAGIDDLSPEEITELGLDPDDFPDVGIETEYKLGQIIPTPQGNMEIVGFYPDGEPAVEPTSFAEGGGREFGGTEAAGEREVSPKFPFRKVGSLRDLVKHLKRPVGSINDLLGR